MSKKSLPIVMTMTGLLIATLACNRLTGSPASGFQATANAVYTQAASGAATVGVQGNSAEATANAALTQAVGQGNSAEATANAAATELVATANAAGGTGGDATATPETGQPTAEATSSGGGGGTTADGGPSDIPLVDANNTILIASAQLVSYQTTADIATTIKFYKDSMPSNGWTADPTTSVETPTATVLAFKKDNRAAQVSIAGDPTSNKTIVLITIS
jgi:hypothetical protein